MKFLKTLLQISEDIKQDAFKEALKVECPLCKALPNKMCTSVKGKLIPMNTLHNERLRAAGFGSAKEKII